MTYKSAPIYYRIQTTSNTTTTPATLGVPSICVIDSWTTTTNASGSFSKIGGANIQIQYDGTKPLRYQIVASVGITTDTDNMGIDLTIYKNGSPIGSGSFTSRANLWMRRGTEAQSCCLNTIDNNFLVNGDTIELYQTSSLSNNVLIKSLTFMIIEI